MSFKSPTGDISRQGDTNYSNHVSNVQLLKAHVKMRILLRVIGYRLILWRQGILRPLDS